MTPNPCVYIVASERNGTLYIGVTSDLPRRAWEHRESLLEGFSKQYGTKRLVYYEFHESMDAAITREKQLKKWNRSWKLELIEAMNPKWDDLFDTVNG